MDPLVGVVDCMDLVHFHDIPQLGHGIHYFSGTGAVVGVVGLSGDNLPISVDKVVVVVVGALCLEGNMVPEDNLQFDVVVLVGVGNMGVVVVVGVGAVADCKYIHHVVVEVVVVGTVVVVEVDSHNLLGMANILQFSVVVVVVVVSVDMGVVVGIVVVDMGEGVLGVEDSYFLVVEGRGLVVVDDDYGNVHDDGHQLQHGHALRHSVDV